MRKMVLVFVCLAVTVPLVFGLRGCRSEGRPLMVFFDMDFQPKYRPQGESAFFADGKSQRRPLPGTVAYGGADYFSDAGHPTKNADLLAEDDEFYRGKSGDQWVLKSPAPLSMESLRRGQIGYRTFCQVCHGGTGEGNGIISEYGLAGIANLVDQRVKDMPAGQIYHTIGNGKGLMQGYGHQIQPADRWDIVQYIRALQRARSASIGDVPEPFRAELTENE